MAVLKDLIVHGRSRFVNGAQFNTINAESIGANEGIFNKLIATTLDAKEATIEDLTATNAVVTGLLDVQGQMQTNSWTNSNIATIDGSFYICPTISSEAVVTTSGATQTSNNKFLYNGSTVTLTGTWATTGSLYLNTTASNWTLYSKVMLTGEVLIGTEWTPIGTIRGVLTGINASNGTITIGSLSTNITPGSDGTINSAPMILSLVTTNTTYNARKLKVSLYEYNTAGTSSGATNLIGIMMTTAGTHNFTYLDIYNGLNSKTSYTSTIDNTTKATEPMVRIGNLNGLPNIVTNGTADTQPSGWGIYTTNGYFKGKIVSNAGYIGGYTIGTDNLTKGATRDASGSFWITPAQSSNSSMSKLATAQWAITTGQNFGVTTAGKLYAKEVNIQGTIDATSFKARDSNLKTRAEVNLNGLLIYDDTGTSTTYGNLIAQFGSTIQMGNLSIKNNEILFKQTGSYDIFQFNYNDSTCGYCVNNPSLTSTNYNEKRTSVTLVHGSNYTVGTRYFIFIPIYYATDDTFYTFEYHIFTGGTAYSKTSIVNFNYDGNRTISYSCNSDYYTFAVEAQPITATGASYTLLGLDDSAIASNLKSYGGLSHGGSSVFGYKAAGINNGNAIGNYSLSIGNASYTVGLASVSGGHTSIAYSAYSFAFGDNANTFATNSIALGDHVIANREGQLVFGKYNNIDDQALLVIGNGIASARSNALTVDWDGNMHIDLAGYATPDTTDKKIYDALYSLGWISEVTA